MPTDSSLTYGEYSRQMEQKLQMQKQHYEELTQKVDEISRMRHDMRHHLRTVMAYAQQEKYQETDGIPAGVCIRYDRRGKANLLLQKHGRRCGDPFLCRRTESREGFLLNVI